MPNYNSYQCMGYLGQDPKVTITPEGKKIVNISLAVHEKTKDNQEKTLWVNVVFFNGQAELAEQYLHKGSCVQVIGPLETEEWANSKGEKRFGLKVKARQLIFIDSKDREQQLSEANYHDPDYANQ